MIHTFIKRIIVFIIPLVIIRFSDVFMPIGSYSYRPWEALLSFSGSGFPFYPNQEIEMISVGDLCHHRSSAIEKNEYWKTDQLGYRNNSFIKKPDVLIVGDSFVAGSSVMQHETLANQLMRTSNGALTVYALAPATFNDFVNLLEQGIIQKPNMLIFSIVERNIPVVFTKETFVTKKISIQSNIDILIDRAERFYLLEYLKARWSHRAGYGVRGEVDARMFFYNNTHQKDEEQYVEQTFRAIKSYKQFCDKEDIVFMFLPTPNKKTVYYDFVPFKDQNTELLTLDSLLSSNHIHHINTLNLYNQYREKEDAILYNLDDTHWNAQGINIVAKNIYEYIQQHISLQQQKHSLKQ